MKHKPSSKQVSDYLKMLHDTNSQIGILRALHKQGYTEPEMLRYLTKEGKTYEDSIGLIRELNE